MTEVLDRTAAPRRATRPEPAPAGAEARRFERGWPHTPGLAALLAALSAGAGAIHLAMFPSHWSESVVEGLAFAAGGWLQIAIAALLLRRAARATLGAAIVVSAAAIAVWIVSRTAGLPFGAHAGHAESVGFVDLTCVALEAALIIGAAALLLRPHLDAPVARFGAAATLVAIGAVLALTTSALASPGALDHAAHSHGDHAAGHVHGTPAGGDDRGFSLLVNGQHEHTTVQHTLDAPTRTELRRQLLVTRSLSRDYPTVAAAERDGFKRVGPYIPGIGAHYWRSPIGTYGRGPEWNADGVFDDEELRHPLMLIFDGTTPASKLAGFMFYSTKGSEPEGFAGRNDTWHFHENLCLKLGADGTVDVPFGLDNSATPQQCANVGAQIIPTSGYMVHVWSVPGFEMTAEYGGVFGELNPKLDCPDGTYYQLPLDEWASHPMNVCRAQPRSTG
jgi:hypothetical protein